MRQPARVPHLEQAGDAGPGSRDCAGVARVDQDVADKGQRDRVAAGRTDAGGDGYVGA